MCLSNMNQSGLFGELGQLARDCLERLTRHKENRMLVRTMPPSKSEIDAITGCGQLACLVCFEDKTNKAIDIDSVTTASELLDALGDMRKLRGWALFEVISSANLYTEHILKPEDSICDIMAKWERFHIPKGVDGDVEFQFVFKKYVFIRSEQPKDVSHPIGGKLLFYQIINTVLRGRLPTSEEEAVFLAACHLQYEKGDYNAGINVEEILPNYMPKNFLKAGLKKGQEAQATLDKTATLKGNAYQGLSQKVKLVWGQLQGKSKVDLVGMYLSKLSDNPLYGAMLFPVQYVITRKNIKPCLLAVSEDGIQIWDPMSKQAIKRIEFKHIASYGPKKGSLAVTTGSLINPVVESFNTEESFEISDVLKSYQTSMAGVYLQIRKDRNQ
jgi:hypothetical protein